jgi:hypothetical protein
LNTKFSTFVHVERAAPERLRLVLLDTDSSFPDARHSDWFIVSV